MAPPSPSHSTTTRTTRFSLGKLTADLAIGPIEVTCQNLLYADQNWIQPDEISAGVLGLAYPESFDTQSAQSSPSSGKLVAVLQC